MTRFPKVVKVTGRTKYNVRTDIRRLTGYHSAVEARRAAFLKGLANIGHISGLKEQPAFDLSCDCGCLKMRYKADFEYVISVPIWDGFLARYTNVDKFVIEDVKGMETERFKLIKKLWPFSGPAPLDIVRQDRRGNWIVTETVKGKA